MHFSQATLALTLLAANVLAIPVAQLAGEGSAANSILSGTDNAVGYGVEDALDNTANLITSIKGGASSGGASSGGPPPPPSKRQADKISKGVQAVSDALGTGDVTAPVTDEGVTLDGQLTSGAAAAGAAVGSAEESTLEAIGSAAP